MSPSAFTSSSWDDLFYINLDGGLYNGMVSVALGVRPVINLRADTQLTGSGTTSDPYVVN